MNKESRRILKSSSVLLIEDDGRVREKFNRLLSVYVNKVYEASNAETAFEIYHNNKPCFIIAYHSANFNRFYTAKVHPCCIKPCGLS